MFSALRRILDYRVVSTEFRVCQQGDQDTLACLGAGVGLSGQGLHRDPGPGLPQEQWQQCTPLVCVPARYQMLLGK